MNIEVKIDIKTMLKHEFITGKTWFDWAFIAVGLIMQIVGIVAGYMTGQPDSIGLIVSGLTGVLATVLCSQGRISFYIFAYIQLITYVVFFSIPNSLHGETVENIMYFITMVYGVYVWFKNYGEDTRDGSTKLVARRLGVLGNIVTVIIFAVGTIVYYHVLKTVPMFGSMDSDPFFDSITSVPAYIGQLFMVLGFREQWIYWFILDFFSIILAWRAGSMVMVAQFIFWTLNCIYGWVNYTNFAKQGGN